MTGGSGTEGLTGMPEWCSPTRGPSGTKEDYLILFPNSQATGDWSSWQRQSLAPFPDMERHHLALVRPPSVAGLWLESCQNEWGRFKRQFCERACAQKNLLKTSKEFTNEALTESKWLFIYISGSLLNTEFGWIDSNFFMLHISQNTLGNVVAWPFWFLCLLFE